MSVVLLSGYVALAIANRGGGEALEPAPRTAVSMMHDGSRVRSVGHSMLDHQWSRTSLLGAEANATAPSDDARYARTKARLDAAAFATSCASSANTCEAGPCYSPDGPPSSCIPLVGFIAFPNSGSTWLGLIFEEATGIAREVNATYYEGGSVRPYGAQVLAHGDSGDAFVRPAAGVEPRPVKDHNVLAWPRYTRVVALLRDPIDNVHSTYAFTQRSYPEHLEGKWSESEYFTAMAHDLASWRCHLTSVRVPLLLVKYEELLAEPAVQLRRVIEFTGYSVSDAALQRALERYPVEPHATLNLAAAVPNATLRTAMLDELDASPSSAAAGACGDFRSPWRATVGA